MTETTPSRVVVYLTRDEYERLSDVFLSSEYVNSRNTYGANHPLGEYIRESLGDTSTVDISDYEKSAPSVRYTETVTVEFPPTQYESLQEQFESTPVAEDPNGRHALGGNAPFAEYLRLCITQLLARDEDPAHPLRT